MNPKNAQPTKKVLEQRVLEQRALERKLSALNPVEAPVGRPFYDSFDSYVADYPEGECFRSWVTARGREKNIALFLGTSVDDNALPGHYLWASLSEYPGIEGKAPGRVQLSLHDNDDGLAIMTWPLHERTQAQALFEQMKALAPFSMRDAVDVFQLRRE